jgi:hypothetical protein
MKRTHLSGMSALILTAGVVGAASAGPVSDFEASYRGMYATYRAALFATNTGDPAKATAALTHFADEWTTLTSTYAAAPPPQYQDDPLWSDTVSTVTALVDEAGSSVEAGNLPEAHEILEDVRESLSQLHARNGIETFSDRMNAYHAEMEVILGMSGSAFDTGSVPGLLESAGVLAYLAEDVLAAPPPEAEGNDSYRALAGEFEASVTAFVSAVRAADIPAIQAAIANLKPAYSKFFLNFG